MTLDMEKMNDKLIVQWLDTYTNLSEHDKDIFLNIKKIIKSDLSLFYDMNRIIVKGKGELYIKEVGIDFQCCSNKCILKSIYGDICLDNAKFREIITTFIEIYEPIYPIGTVVELKKEAFKGVIDIEASDKLIVVIAHRFVPINEKRYFPYIGIIYPYGATKETNNGLHFTSVAVKKIIHNGYTDEQELAYIFNLKKKAIIELNMHSTAFLTADEYIRINNNTKVTN